MPGTRARWALKGQVHDVREVTFDEDVCRASADNPPKALAGPRNLAISARISGQMVQHRLRPMRTRPQPRPIPGLLRLLSLLKTGI